MSELEEGSDFLDLVDEEEDMVRKPLDRKERKRGKRGAYIHSKVSSELDGRFENGKCPQTMAIAKIRDP